MLNYELFTLLNNSLAPSSRASYKNALGHFITFVQTYYPSSSVFPASADTLAQFITSCHLRQLRPSTITTYISAVGYIHKLYGWANPSDSFIVKKLLQALRKIQPADKRHPFTTDKLRSIVTCLPTILADPFKQRLYKAMILTSFFGLLRVGEIALSPKGQPNVIQRHNLGLAHKGNKVTGIDIYMSSFKHSQGQGSHIPLALQPLKQICPVRALLAYLKLAPAHPGPLFQHVSGVPVTVSEFRSVLRSCVLACHLDPSLYTSHSLRIGGATHAHLRNMSPSQICRLGRWKSSAFKKYIRIDTLPLQT